jgi:hypothetical protein
MKTITVIFLLINFNFLGQKTVKYKRKCDKAYSYFLAGNYSKFINEIEKIERNYRLMGEELVHKSIAYGRLNQKEKAVIEMSKSWNALYIDASFRLYDMFKIDSLLNFTKSDWQIVKDNNKNFDISRGLIYSDSLKKILTERMDLDQFLRESMFSQTDTILRKEIAEKIEFEDSISGLVLSEIIFKHGFPGDSICHLNQSIGELVLYHATSKDFFLKHNLTLKKQIDLGLISPYAYAYWYDRCMMRQNLPTKYFNYYFLPKKSKKSILKYRKKIGMSIYYEIENSNYN